MFPLHSAISLVPKSTPVHTDQKHISTETAEGLDTQAQSVLAEPDFPLPKTRKNWAWGSRQRQLGPEKRGESTLVLEVKGSRRGKKGIDGRTLCVRFSVDPQKPGTANGVLGTRSRDEAKRENLIPEQNQEWKFPWK